MLTRYFPKRKAVKTRKLLSGGELEETEEKEVDNAEVMSLYFISALVVGL